MPLLYKPITALTGATGFLGSHLMAALLKEGFKIIILGRSNKNESLNVRISKLLIWFGLEEHASQLELMETDFLKPHLGLEKENYDKLCHQTEQVIHCASDTSFSENKRNKNLTGMEKMGHNAPEYSCMGDVY